MTDFTPPKADSPPCSDFLMIAGELSVVPKRKEIVLAETVALQERMAQEERALNALDGHLPPSPPVYP